MKKPISVLAVIIILSVVPWFAFAEDTVIYDALRYQTGNYTYEAPASWDVKEISDTRQHSLGDSIFYSVSLITVPGDDGSADCGPAIDKMIDYILNDPVRSTIELDFGQSGYLAIGESSITDGKTVYALYFENSPGFLQVVYSNSSSGDAWPEFELLISTFSLSESKSNNAASENKFISLGDIGYPVEKLLLKIGYLNISYTISADPEPIMDEAAQKALMQFQIDTGIEPTGAFDSETACRITGDLQTDEADLVWIPMHGGRKYHSKENCSSMIESRQLPCDCAVALGFSPCGRCY